MNFLSIGPRFHSSLTSSSVHPPACSQRLLSHSLPLPMRLQRKAPRSVPLAPKWVPLSRRNPQSVPYFTPHTDEGCMGSVPSGGGDRGLRKAGDAGKKGGRIVGATLGAPTWEGIGDCALPSTLTGPPVATCSLSPSDPGESEARRRSPLRSPM